MGLGFSLSEGEYRLGMFENGVLRIFGRKRDEVTEELRRPHNEELYDLCFLPYVIRVIKSRRMIMGRVCDAYEKQ